MKPNSPLAIFSLGLNRIRKNRIMRNVLITGIPRSGTTLTCHLLNKVPNVIALHEPFKFRQIIEKEGIQAVPEKISEFITQSRHSLLTTGTAISKHIGGKVPDNPFEHYSFLARLLPKYIQHQLLSNTFINNIPSVAIRNKLKKLNKRLLRPVKHSKGEVKFSKALDENFLLCIKQNEPFTFMLEILVEFLPCYAIIRNHSL